MRARELFSFPSQETKMQRLVQRLELENTTLKTDVACLTHKNEQLVAEMKELRPGGFDLPSKRAKRGSISK